MLRIEIPYGRNYSFNDSADRSSFVIRKPSFLIQRDLVSLYFRLNAIKKNTGYDIPGDTLKKLRDQFYEIRHWVDTFNDIEKDFYEITKNHEKTELEPEYSRVEQKLADIETFLKEQERAILNSTIVSSMAKAILNEQEQARLEYEFSRLQQELPNSMIFLKQIYPETFDIQAFLNAQVQEISGYNSDDLEDLYGGLSALEDLHLSALEDLHRDLFDLKDFHGDLS